MTGISLKTLSEITNSRLIGDKNAFVSEIIIDSRSIASSSEQVFFALKGNSRDGHQFIPDLYERGVKNFVVSEMKTSFNILKAANFIVVSDTLQEIGRAHV